MPREIRGNSFQSSKLGKMYIAACSEFISPGMLGRSHQEKRVEDFTKVLVHIHLLRTVNCITKDMSVERIGAVFQVGQGTKDMPACHDSPCTIRIKTKKGSVLLYDLLELVHHERIREDIRGCFGSTTILQRLVNYVDSKLERNQPEGLAEAFKLACQEVIQGSNVQHARHADRALINKVCQNLASAIALVHQDVIDQANRGKFSLEGTALANDWDKDNLALVLQESMQGIQKSFNDMQNRDKYIQYVECLYRVENLLDSNEASLKHTVLSHDLRSMTYR